MAFASTGQPVTLPLTSRDTQLAEQGDFFVAVTPTPGTGVISGASVQAFTETTPYFTLYNSSATKYIYPMYLKTHLTVVGATASVAENWTFTLDTGNRYTSGGTALTIANTNMSNTDASAALIFVGAITAPAATSGRRIVSHCAAKHTVIEVVHDTINFNFGGGYQPHMSSTVANTTTPTYANFNLAPVVIGPGQSMVIVRWAGAQTTGSTNEFEFGFVEK
jgi:hypothetical protein